jgi:hypothetical protein
VVLAEDALSQRVYVSHATSDNDMAQQLRTELVARGYDVVGAESAEIGERWTDAIAADMNSADAYVLLISRDWSKTQPALIELGAAVTEEAKRGTPIIPVLVDRRAEPPAVLQDRQFVRLSDRSSVAAVADAVAAALARVTEPAHQDAGSARLERLVDAQAVLEKESVAQSADQVRAELLYRTLLRGVILAALGGGAAIVVVLVLRPGAVATSAAVAGLAAFFAAGLGLAIGRRSGGRS